MEEGERGATSEEGRRVEGARRNQVRAWGVAVEAGEGAEEEGRGEGGEPESVLRRSQSASYSSIMVALRGVGSPPSPSAVVLVRIDPGEGGVGSAGGEARMAERVARVRSKSGESMAVGSCSRVRSVLRPQGRRASPRAGVDQILAYGKSSGEVSAEHQPEAMHDSSPKSPRDPPCRPRSPPPSSFHQQQQPRA